MEILRDDAICEWKRLLGPANSGLARTDAPGSIRALFGTDGIRNAAHGPDSFASAARVSRFERYFSSVLFGKLFYVRIKYFSRWGLWEDWNSWCSSGEQLLAFFLGSSGSRGSEDHVAQRITWLRDMPPFKSVVLVTVAQFSPDLTLVATLLSVKA